jgi:predicted permease
MPVFILIGGGWLLRRKSRLSPQTLKENSFILYWIAMPATLLRGIMSADISVLQSASFLAAVWLPYFVTLALVWATARRGEANERFAVIMLCAIRGNNFFVGIPIVSLAMGTRGVEAGTLILALSMALMQVLSIGGSQLALFGTVSRKTIKSACVQLLKNPLFIACFLGLFLVSTGLNRPPSWISATLALLSDVSTGLALIVLGAGIRLQNFLKNAASVWKIVLFKLAVLPMTTFVVFTCFGLSRDMVQAGVLLASMPVAVNAAVVSQEMGMDSEFCSMGIAVTTLFSLFTLPFLIVLLGLA